MARTNLEERAFSDPRLTHFAKQMKWRKSHAMGTLSFLWHFSQNRMAVGGTKNQIFMWCEAKNDAEGERILSALLSSEYIEEVKEYDNISQESEKKFQLFKIKGNEKHVEALGSLKSRSSLGGKRSRQINNNNNLVEAGLKLPLRPDQVELEPPLRPAEVNSIHSNTKHNNSIQFKAEQGNTKQSNLENQNQENTYALRAESEYPEPKPTPVAKAPRRGAVVPELEGDPIADGYLKQVTVDTQMAWLSVYNDPIWIIDEVKKAHVWLKTNPEKNPTKYMGRFISNWLIRGWERHRKGIPSRRLTNSELNMHAIGDLYKKYVEPKNEN